VDVHVHSDGPRPRCLPESEWCPSLFRVGTQLCLTKKHNTANCLITKATLSELFPPPKPPVCVFRGFGSCMISFSALPSSNHSLGEPADRARGSGRPLVRHPPPLLLPFLSPRGRVGPHPAAAPGQRPPPQSHPQSPPQCGPSPVVRPFCHLTDPPPPPPGRAGKPDNRVAGAPPCVSDAESHTHTHRNPAKPSAQLVTSRVPPKPRMVSLNGLGIIHPPIPPSGDPGPPHSGV